MANDNTFIEELQNSVAEGVIKSDLELKKEELERLIAEIEDNVIKDPKTLEKLKKELAAVNKEIKKEETLNAEKSGDVVGKEASEKDTDKKAKEEESKEEEIKDENSLNEEEKEEVNEEELKQAYHDAMVVMYTKRLETIRRQVSEHQLVSSKEDYATELELEAKMYEARDKYMEHGKDDPYRELRTEYIRKEKEAKEPIERELRERTRKYKLLEEEIRKIDKEQQEINEKLLNPNLTENESEELNKRMGELGQKRKKVELELAKIKANLEPVMKERRQRAIDRAGLEEKHVETLTEEDRKNYDYQQKKINTMNSNFDKATSLEYQNIKRRIEERELKIKRLNQELDKTDDTDFERRLNLLNELDKETNMLEADREAKQDLDRGIKPNEKEMKKDAKEKLDDEEYRQEQFDKQTDDARAFVKEQKEKIGEEVVENPTLANEEERDRETTEKAATFAVIYDDPKPGRDTPLDDLGQYAVAKCVIPELEDKVENPNDPEAAKRYLAQDEAIKADKELDKMQDKLQKEAVK